MISFLMRQCTVCKVMLAAPFSQAQHGVFATLATHKTHCLSPSQEVAHDSSGQQLGASSSLLDEHSDMSTAEAARFTLTCEA